MFALRMYHVMAVFLVASWSQGCDRPASRAAQVVEDDAPRSVSHSSPRELLASIFSRYRNAASYHDRGVVRLSYASGGREESRVAPMNVWLNQNQLYVNAYDVHLLSDAGSMTAWVLDGASRNFDSQVLRIETKNQRPTIDTLFPDPLLADRIAAGLAGPPPQLEWLFAREPMKLLFHSEHRFEFGPSETVDRRLCRSIHVHAENDLYVFWVDETAGIVRRVNLPPVVASPSVGEEIQTMSLSLELNNASFDVPRYDPDIQPLPPNPRYVRQFAPPETRSDAPVQNRSPAASGAASSPRPAFFQSPNRQ